MAPDVCASHILLSMLYSLLSFFLPCSCLRNCICGVLSANCCLFNWVPSNSPRKPLPCSLVRQQIVFSSEHVSLGQLVFLLFSGSIICLPATNARMGGIPERHRNLTYCWFWTSITCSGAEINPRFLLCKVDPLDPCHLTSEFLPESQERMLQ